MRHNHHFGTATLVSYSLPLAMRRAETETGGAPHVEVGTTPSRENKSPSTLSSELADASTSATGPLHTSGDGISVTGASVANLARYSVGANPQGTAKGLMGGELAAHALPEEGDMTQCTRGTVCYVYLLPLLSAPHGVHPCLRDERASG